MKKVLQSIMVAGALVVGSQANAQLPDNGVYPGGLVLTQFGGSPTHDIDAQLDAGKPVIIDLFAVWCSPCWSYHTGGTLETVYNNIGDGGTGQVKIYAVEADDSTPESSMDGGGNSQGDWISGTLYPMCNDDNIADMFNLGYYPTLVLVCPDRTVTEVGQASASQWAAAVNNCGGLASNSNDPRVLENTTDANVTVCPSGGTASTEIKAVVQNYSTAAINGTYTLEATVGATVIASTNANLSLDPYEATEVSLGNGNLNTGNNNITITLTTSNDNLSNDAASAVTSAQVAADLGTGDITITLDFDNYGSEVGMGFASGTVQETDPFAAYPMFGAGTYPGQIDFHNIGTWTNSNTGDYFQYVSLAAGCYHLYMFDNYGDGMTNSSSTTSDDGSIVISNNSTSAQTTMDIDYGSGYWLTFEITSAGTGVGFEEIESMDAFNVFPNPAVDMTTVQFNLTAASNVTVQMYNAVGQIVFSDNMGEVNGLQTVEIGTANLEAGIYMINVNVDGNIITQKVSVIK
ncbi:MAG: T9SS type A sorting domain-containing protein [Crocinitomicaceae bacterium]